MGRKLSAICTHLRLQLVLQSSGKALLPKAFLKAAKPSRYCVRVHMLGTDEEQVWATAIDAPGRLLQKSEVKAQLGLSSDEEAEARLRRMDNLFEV